MATNQEPNQDNQGAPSLELALRLLRERQFYIHLREFERIVGDMRIQSTAEFIVNTGYARLFTLIKLLMSNEYRETDPNRYEGYLFRTYKIMDLQEMFRNIKEGELDQPAFMAYIMKNEIAQITLVVLETMNANWRYKIRNWEAQQRIDKVPNIMPIGKEFDFQLTIIHPTDSLFVQEKF